MGGAEIHSIPLTKERHEEALSYVTSAVNVGGKKMLIEDEDGDRNSAQRGLDWAWSREWAKSKGDTSADWVHGYCKLMYLLPLYHTFGDKRRIRAEFIEKILHRLPEYQLKVAIAYDMVRTSDLTIKQMAEYLTIKQQKAAEIGIYLESNDDLEFKSLMNSERK